MATKIRLQRNGRKSYAFYSIVIADVRAPRDGKFTEKIGTYNPNTNPATVDLNFALDDVSSSGFRHEVKLMDTTTHEVFFDKLTFVYLEMPKFHKTEQELDTLFDKWMFVLKNLARLMERPTSLQERVFNRLFEAAEIAQFSKENLYAYEESLKVYRDWNNVINTAIQKGIAEGEWMKAKAIAGNLKNAGLSIAEIAKVTGLSEDEINSL